MTGLPTFLVELDDGTGTFPDDITTAVSLKAGGSITRGRADEHGSITPTVLRLGIEWSGLSGITTFNDQMIRVTETVGATTSVRFTGYVQDWPVEWPSGGDEYAITRITAVDRLARLARRKLKSMIEHEYLVDAPLLFYPLTEREDSESAGDVSGNGGPSLIPDGAGVVFGATSLDGQGAVTLPAGVSLRSAPGATGISAEASASFWVECFCDFGTPQTNIVSVEFASGATVTLRTDGAGALEARVVTSGGTAIPSSPLSPPGAPTHVAVEVTHNVGATLYVNGVAVDSDAVAGVTTAGFGDIGTVVIGYVAGAADLTVSHVAVGNTNIATARLLDHSLAPFYPGIEESSDDRVARFAGYANIDPADLSLQAGIVDTMPSRQGLSGASAVDALNEVALAEGGLVFINGSGEVVFQNRNHRRSQATAAATLTADAVDPSTVITQDMQQVRNDVAGTRPYGAEQQATNRDSIDAHEQYPDSLDLQVATDAEVRDRIDWIAGVYAEPQPRIGQLTVDLITQSQANQEIVLGLEISDRVDLSGMPSQTPAAALKHIIEGWTESFSATSWQITFNVSPFEFERTWILGDPVYGLLGETTRLGY